MSTAVEPPITESAIVLSLVDAYGVTLEQLEHAVRQNLDQSARIKQTDDLWNMKVKINRKWFDVGHTREPSGRIHVIGFGPCK
jgi:hypothetical protein